MRIPDEALYKKGEVRIEDTEGYVLCPHCDKCTITHENQIFTDGMFYCLHRRRWKKGDDLIEFKCDGYRTKSCDTCTYKDCEDKDKGTYCNSYRKKGMKHHGMFFMGRKRPMRDKDVKAMKAEEIYIEYKRKLYDNQRNGIDEAREHQQDKEGNAKLGAVQISYSDKEGEIRFPLAKEGH